MLETIQYQQTNDKCWIELLMLNSNTWNHLTVSNQMISCK